MDRVGRFVVPSKRTDSPDSEDQQPETGSGAARRTSESPRDGPGVGHHRQAVDLNEALENVPAVNALAEPSISTIAPRSIGVTLREGGAQGGSGNRGAKPKHCRDFY